MAKFPSQRAGKKRVEKVISCKSKDTHTGVVIFKIDFKLRSITKG